MRLSSLAAAVAAACCATAHASGTFVPLQTPSAQITKISQNGEYLTAALSGTGGVRWTAETGDEELVPGMDYSSGINNFGTVSGAIPVDGGSGNKGHDLPAVSLLGESTPVELPLPTGTDNANVYDVADDGTAVGLAWSDDFSVAKAYFWTSADGATDLPVTDPDAASRGNMISADGLVIGGWNDDPVTGFRRGVIWQNRVPFYPLDAMGNNVGEADGVSGNGKFVVGSTYQNLDGSVSSWLWNADTGEVIAIPVMPFAFGVSDDGKTVVGASGFFDVPSRAAYIWTEAGGSELLTDYLAERAIEVPQGWDFQGGLTGVSGDGTIIGGWTAFGPNGTQSFIVTGANAPVDHIFADGFDGAPAPNPVTDGSFEETVDGVNPFWDSVDGNPAAGGGTSFYNANMIPTHTGIWAVWFGGWTDEGSNAAETQTLSQSVTIPSAGPAFLNYWRYAAGLPDVAGTLSVSVDGTEVDSTDLTTLTPDKDYVPVSVDVSAYADGGTHTIELQFDYPGTGTTDGNVFVDDVSIDATGNSTKTARSAHAMSRTLAAKLRKPHR